MAPAEESQLYRDLIRLKPDDLSLNAWAVRAGVNRTVWADMRRHGNPSRRTLEKLLTAAGSSLAEFEALRIDERPGHFARAPGTVGVGDHRPSTWRAAPLTPLPLLATSIAGEWRNPGSRIELTHVDPSLVLEHLERTSSLASDPEAYALAIVGDSMWPRFRPGRRIAVSPRSPVAIGDDVVVQLSKLSNSGAGTDALVKELIRRSVGGIELRQFNPDIRFQIDAADIAAIHKVVGELF